MTQRGFAEERRIDELPALLDAAGGCNLAHLTDNIVHNIQHGAADGLLHAAVRKSKVDEGRFQRVLDHNMYSLNGAYEMAE